MPQSAKDASSTATRAHWILRVSTAACFVGHGAFGILTKADWLPFFAIFGIGPEWAYRLMPLIGCTDIALGISILLWPTRLTLAWMTFWCVWTAFLRPLSGMSFLEVLERGGNYGVPCALLILSGAGPWLGRLRATAVDTARLPAVRRVLVAATALLLVGHGGFGLVLVKPMLVRHLSTVGLGSADTLRAQGALEIVAGLLTAVAGPVALTLVAAWKLATESLYVAAGAPVWEVVERGGSYGAPLALAAIRSRRLRAAADELSPAA